MALSADVHCYVAIAKTSHSCTVSWAFDFAVPLSPMGYGMLSRRLAYGQGMNERAGTYVATPERPAFVGVLDKGLRIARAVHTGVPSNVRVLPRRMRSAAS